MQPLLNTMEAPDLPSDFLDFLSDKTTDTANTEEEGESSFIRRSVIQRNCHISGQLNPPSKGSINCQVRGQNQHLPLSLQVCLLLSTERSVSQQKWRFPVRDRRRKCWSVCYHVITAMWSSAQPGRGRATQARGRACNQPENCSHQPGSCLDQSAD